MTNRARPFVTIAIPTYNRADCYLRQALQSARNQTYSNLEIIVSDNCSVDDTEMVVTSIADLRLRYFKHPSNIGATKNFNFCLKEAKGEYFLLLSDDDLIDDDFVDISVKAIDGESDIGVIRTGIRTIDANGKVLGERLNMAGGYPTDAFFRAWFAGKAPVYLCNTLFHTKRLSELGGFGSKYNLYDDAIAHMVLAAKYGRIDVQEVKASARLHEAEMTFAADIHEWCEESLTLLDLMCELVSENRTLIRREGMQFFSRVNYFRARAVKSSLKRLIAYMIVFKMFNYRYPPSLYPRRLRGIKVKMKQLLSAG